MAMSGAPKRYFDNGRDNSSPRGGRGGGGSRGGSSRGGRGGARGGRPQRDDRPKKEAFKPKEGFIAAGLKAYADSADAAALEKKASLSEGWTDKTTTQTTLHLTHLPSALTSPQLSLLCSSYAPLRSAFVVSTSSHSSTGASAAGEGANAISTGPGRERTGKTTSRGFGYVRFVLRTDAEKCLEEWGASGGIPRSACKELEDMEGMEDVEWDKVCGRGGIKMAWAKKKLREGEEPEGGAKEKKVKVVKEKKERPVVEVKEERERREWIDYDAEDAPPRPAGAFDRAASRTVIVQGLSVPLTEEERAAKTAKKEAEGAMDVDEEEGAEKADEEDEEGEEAGKPIDWKKVLKQKAKKTGDVEEVQWPVTLSSGEVVATVLLPTPRIAHELMKKLNNHVFKGLVISACVKSSWDLVQHLGRGKGGGRLVVRNLGFDVSIPDLRTVFSRFGSLHSINLPLDATGTPRGFAFIYYLSKSSATAALTAINGTRIYGGLAKERVESEGGKGGKKKEVREKKKREEAAGGGGGGEKGRVVAVDWALGKDEWKRAQEEEKAKESGSGEEESGTEEESDEEENEEDEDSDMSPVPEGAEEEEEEEEEEEVDEVRHADDDDDELDEEPKGPEPPKGTTLFVRNMSFEATESELYDLFKVFGPVRYARIVYDPTTKRSRGTAFVCFWNDEDAQKVLYESESLNAGLFGETANKKDKSAPSLLMADAGSSKAAKLTLHGRVLAAVSAVSKDDADKLREDRDKKGAAKTDRRNLYLMREGVIFPSWAIAQTLHPTDLAARQSSFDARKALLRSNPSLYISRTRLSVRQIPLYVSDGMMKRLANYAMKEFEKDVKNGHQKALTNEEKSTFILDASNVPLPPTKAERIRGVPPSRVRQSKILRQADRVDPLTGLGRSKGYGFLELGCHADALRVLRWANANKDVGALFRMWWREALEGMIAKVETGEGGVGKGVTVKDKEERLKRLKEKMSELVEEEELAKGKAAKKEAKGGVAGEGGRNQKLLIIEFSIENATTTKRRADKADRARERANRTRARDASDDESGDESDGLGAAKSDSKKRKNGGDDGGDMKKKIKVANDKKGAVLKAEEGEKDAPQKSFNVGAAMGRKRAKGKKGK